ncbi:hypothetical protein PAI11_01440 [Patulibacter medicamentivorans]|uniref:eRF1 domain-containing protein n=1 Tax=Patulibacter medicamentivorans TaxID=1097667 RepID=H0E039_9ACTN|nr:Vms1/Ankzf1 family peptidyl-tRNA hydrolase [Patulibacter medicamentivorans]EHN12998.1 hypothetical protein PAI11_01440 [Patulibacter medicamentivorans]
MTATTSPQIDHLLRLETGGAPILSVYVDLDPGHFPTPTAREREINALLVSARQHASAEDIEPLAERLRDEAAGSGAGHGLAAFSCAAAGLLEVLRLPHGVPPMVVVDSVPWIEPLVGATTDEGWGVAVVSRRGARLLRGGPTRLVEFARIEDDVHGRHAQGGWSQARYQRGIEEQVDAHVRGVAERLLRAHRRSPFGELVIVASDELLPNVRASLHGDLAAVLAGTVARDLEHATIDELTAAVAPVVEAAERDRERELLARVGDGLATGGRAAAGLDEVLAVLAEGRVTLLLVAEDAELTARRCPTCGWMTADARPTCPDDDTPLVAVDAVAHLLDATARRAAPTVVVHHEREALAARGSVAALLNW